MTKTAVNDLRPCWRCDGITFWRARDGVVHCATCEPAHAAWLIAERLRAVPVPPSQLRRAMRFILLGLNGAGTVSARAVIDSATRAKIAPAMPPSKRGPRARTGHGPKVSPLAASASSYQLGFRQRRQQSLCFLARDRILRTSSIY
jgi:hypothetical protein